MMIEKIDRLHSEDVASEVRISATTNSTTNDGGTQGNALLLLVRVLSFFVWRQCNCGFVEFLFCTALVFVNCMLADSRKTSSFSSYLGEHETRIIDDYITLR
jgi:hypothetical protein